VWVNGKFWCTEGHPTRALEKSFHEIANLSLSKPTRPWPQWVPTSYRLVHIMIYIRATLYCVDLSVCVARVRPHIHSFTRFNVECT
jgi:hypothetical protein